MKLNQEKPICPHCYTALIDGACPACGYRTLVVSRVKRVLLMFSGLLCLALLAGGGLWFTYYDKIKYDLTETQGIIDPYADFEVSVKPPDYQIRQGFNPVLSKEQLIYLRTLFEGSNFAELTRALERLQISFEKDHLTERVVCDAFALFDTPRDDFGPLLDAWIATYPDHYAPYLARGRYLMNMGWHNRGTRFAKDTSKEQKSTMKSYFREAYADLEKALGLNPNLLPAYRAMISISNGLGNDLVENELFDKARRLFPESFMLYAKMMWAKLPRWGGSYAEMDRLAIEAQEQGEQNREMIFLPGYIYVDQAWNAERQKEYDKALAYYDKALAYGKSSHFYYERSRTFRVMKDRQRELKDLQEFISLRPSSMKAYKRRAEVWIYLNNQEQAIRDIETAWSLTPYDPKLLEMHAWASNVRRQQREEEQVKVELEQQKVERRATTASFDLKPESSISVEEAFMAPSGTQPTGLTWKTGKLYLASYLKKAGLYEIDPANGQVLRHVQPKLYLRNHFGGLASDGRDIYHIAAKNGSKAARLKGDDLAVADQYLLRCNEKTLTDITVYDQAIYVVGTNDLYKPEAYSLLKFSLDGKLLESFEYHQENPRNCIYNMGMTSDGHWLWVSTGKKLLRIDPVSGNILHAYPLDKPRVESLAWDGHHIWAASFNGMVYKITINDG